MSLPDGMASHSPVLELPDGLTFLAGGRTVGIEPLALYPGDWIALTPEEDQSGPDLASAAARILVTLASPLSGTLVVLGKATSTLDYMDLLHLRSRIGFVQGRGGLLSNRTLRDNIALPLSVHGRVTPEQEDQRVAEILAHFDLERFALLRPHEVDGITRFRACVARALSLSPDWLVIEDIGAFETETPESVTWRRLMDYRARSSSAAAVCLGRRRPTFESWFCSQGGRVLQYRLPAGTSRDRERIHGP